MAVAQTPLASSKVVVPLTFSTNGILANQTSGTLPNMLTSGGTLNANTYVLPWDASIVAMSARLPTAPTAGTLTLQPRIDGSLTDFTVTKHVNSTDIQGFYARQEARIKTSRLVAGHNIGLSYTTTSDWAAVVPGEFIVFVLMESVDI